MPYKLIPVAILFAGLGLSATAQTKDAPKKEEESITIRKKKDSKEKLTIVIDGDKITINGKPLEELKDADIQVLRNKVREIRPMVKAGLAPMGSMKMLRDVPVNRAFLGVASEKTDKGAKITSVTKESAAEKAGLQTGDIITKIGDKYIIEGSEDLYNTISDFHPGDTITITYLRDGKEATTSATLGKNSSPEQKVFNFNNHDFNFEMPDIDLRGLHNMNSNMDRKPRLGVEIQDIEEGKGVKVLEVDTETPAAKAGLQKGDIITGLDGKPIASVDELKAKLRESKEGDTIKVTYQRNGQTQTTDIKFPKKLKTADL